MVNVVVVGVVVGDGGGWVFGCGAGCWCDVEGGDDSQATAQAVLCIHHTSSAQSPWSARHAFCERSDQTALADLSCNMRQSRCLPLYAGADDNK